jgi:D-glycero-alpha-D-manno-heptose-7-phosphate kinase
MSITVGELARPAFAFMREAGHIVRAKAPLRLSFAGGGTDLPHWYMSRHGGVLSATIDRYAYVTLYPRDDDIVNIRSLDLGYSVRYNLGEEPAYDGILDLAKAALRRLDLDRGIDLDIRSDAPPGSGLGGSSALTAAIVGAVAAFKGYPITAYEFAELNYEIERTDVGIKGGKQDQYAATFGGFNHIEFYCDSVLVNGLRIEQSILNDLEAHLLLCYTGQVRTDLDLISTQVDLYQQGRVDTIRGMERLYEMVFAMKEALLRRRLDDFGALLHDAYIGKKMMNPRVSEGTIADLLYEAAREHGALGGKLLGAGGGGYLALYCPTDRQHELRRALEALGGQFIDFGFESLGLQVWRSQCR